jgi:hypothetical protein
LLRRLEIVQAKNKNSVVALKPITNLLSPNAGLITLALMPVLLRIAAMPFFQTLGAASLGSAPRIVR